MKPKAGEILSLKVDDLSPGAQGMATLESHPVFVKEGLPGDQVQARVSRVRQGLTEAKILQLENPSPVRVLPRCQHFGPCGGCSLQHMDYLPQVEWKLKDLTRVLAAEGSLRHLPPVQVIRADEPWGYRSKMEFSFGQEGERITLGLHERSSFQRVVDIIRCHIAAPGVSELLLAIKEVANRFSLRSYNPKIHQGFWRYAVVRSSFSSGDLMLLIVTNDGPEEPIAALARELPIQIPALKSIYWGISTRVSDVASPERMVPVAGSEVLEDRVGEIRFQIRPTNFVQPNLTLASRIYETIREEVALTGQEVVYDLYCGIGLIALSVAKAAKAVYGVESEEENVAAAERNAALNGIANAVFLRGKVEDLLKGRALFKAGPKPDLIVLDPPRVGLHKEVYAPLLEAGAPTLIYLSCNPSSLARDLKVLMIRDPRYRVERVSMFDFFPHTTHVEVLVTLKKQ